MLPVYVNQPDRAGFCGPVGWNWCLLRPGQLQPVGLCRLTGHSGGGLGTSEEQMVIVCGEKQDPMAKPDDQSLMDSRVQSVFVGTHRPPPRLWSEGDVNDPNQSGRRSHYLAGVISAPVRWIGR